MKRCVRRKEVVRAHALAHAPRRPEILQNGRPLRVQQAARVELYFSARPPGKKSLHVGCTHSSSTSRIPPTYPLNPPLLPPPTRSLIPSLLPPPSRSLDPSLPPLPSRSLHTSLPPTSPLVSDFCYYINKPSSAASLTRIPPVGPLDPPLLPPPSRSLNPSLLPPLFS